jgi:hypothetical protein
MKVFCTSGTESCFVAHSTTSTGTTIIGVTTCTWKQQQKKSQVRELIGNKETGKQEKEGLQK